MSKKVFPTDVIRQAQKVLSGWLQISTTLVFGSLTSTVLTPDLTAIAPLDAEINKLESQLNDKRVRASVRGIYGDDSAQYELVGGTRMSERKARARRTLPA